MQESHYVSPDTRIEILKLLIDFESSEFPITFSGEKKISVVLKTVMYFLIDFGYL